MLSMCWLLHLDNRVLNTIECTTYPHSAIFSLRVGFFVFFLLYIVLLLSILTGQYVLWEHQSSLMLKS